MRTLPASNDPRWQDLLEQTGLSDERLSAIQFDVVAETSSMPTKAAAAAVG